MTNLPARYETGELLDLRIPGLRYDAPYQGGHRLVGEGTDAEPYEIVLPAGARYELARVAPKEWPPQTGDIWVDAQGREWMGWHVDEAGMDPYDVLMRMEDGDGSTNAPVQVLAENVADAYGPMRLLRRRGWSPTAPADEPEPAEVDAVTDIAAGLREFADLYQAHPELPGRPSMAHVCLHSMTDLTAWASVFGADIQHSPDETGNIHHRVEGKVRGLSVSAFFIESAPKPEPAPAAPVAEKLQTRCPDADIHPGVSCDWVDDGTDQGVCVEARAVQDRGDAEPVDEDQADETAASDEVNCTVGLVEPDADHAHLCALYVDAGPHLGDHVCREPDCGKHWSDDDEPEAGA